MANPAVSQRAWRWYQDDATGGDPNTCTAYGPEVTSDATAASIYPTDTDLQLRVSLDETSNRTGTGTITWQYQINGTGGTWNDITTSSSNVRLISTNSSATEGQACTQLLSGVGGDSYQNGVQVTGAGDGDSAYSVTVAAKNNFWEDQCALTLRSADLSAGDVVYIRANPSGNFDADATQIYARALIGPIGHEPGSVVAHAPSVTAIVPYSGELQFVSVTGTPASIETSTSSVSWATLDQMTIQPGVGTYLVIGTVTVDIGSMSTTVACEIRLSNAGAADTGTTRDQQAETSFAADEYLLMMTHSILTVENAADAVAIQWRVDTASNTAYAYNRQLMLMPLADGIQTYHASDTTQGTGTSSTTTTDFSVTPTGMGFTSAGTGQPAAGDYIMVFSSSTDVDVGNNTTEVRSEVRPYVGGSEVGSGVWRRRTELESSYPTTKFPIFMVAAITCNGSQDVELRWARTGGGAGEAVRLYDKTLSLIQVSPSSPQEYWTATSSTSHLSDTSTSYELMDSMSITPGAGEYLAIHTGPITAQNTPDLVEAAIHTNDVLESDSETLTSMPNSMDPDDNSGGGSQLSLVTMSAVNPTAGQTVRTYWKSSTTGTRGLYERGLVVFAIPTVANTRTVSAASLVARAPSVTVTYDQSTTVNAAPVVQRAPAVTTLYNQATSVAAAALLAVAPAVTASAGAVSRTIDAAPTVQHAPTATASVGAVSRTITAGSLLAYAPAVATQTTVARSVGSTACVYAAPAVTASVGAVTRTVGAGSLVAYAPPAVGSAGNDRTIGVAPLVSHAPSVAVQAGAVSRSVGSAGAVLTAPTATAALTTTVAVGSAVNALHAPAVTTQVGAATRSVGSAHSALYAPAVTAQASATQVVGVAPLVAVAPSASASVGAISRSVDAAALTAYAPAVTVTAGAVSRSVNAGSLLAYAPAATVSGPQSASVGSTSLVTHAPSAIGLLAGFAAVNPAPLVAYAPTVTTTTGAISRTVAAASTLLRAPAVTTTQTVTRSVGSTALLAHAPSVTAALTTTRSAGAASLLARAPTVTTSTGAVSRSVDVAVAVLHPPAATATQLVARSVGATALVAHAPAVTVVALTTRSVSAAAVVWRAAGVTVTTGAVSRTVGSTSLVAHAPLCVGLLSFPQSETVAVAYTLVSAPAVANVALTVAVVPPTSVDVDSTVMSVECDSTETYIETDATYTEVGVYE